jgi:hypothetical protein
MMLLPVAAITINDTSEYRHGCREAREGSYIVIQSTLPRITKARNQSPHVQKGKQNEVAYNHGGVEYIQ